jgi:hypothetical protein
LYREREEKADTTYKMRNIPRWVSVTVDAAFGSVYRADVYSAADDSEIYAATIFSSKLQAACTSKTDNTTIFFPETFKDFGTSRTEYYRAVVATLVL